MSDFFDFTRVPITGRMGKPTDLEMELINRQALDALEPDEVFVFSSRASDGNKDTHHSWMAPSTLRNYADDYKEGRPFLTNHDPTQVMGRTFNGDFENGSTLISTYVLRGVKIADIPSDDFIRAVRAGIRKDVSVRFTGGDRICDLCENDILSRSCIHLPGRQYEGKKATYGIHDARAAEVSSVWRASNSQAVILKASDLRTRGLLTDREIDEYNIQYECNLRAEMTRPDILSLAAVNLRSDESYLLRAIKAYVRG